MPHGSHWEAAFPNKQIQDVFSRVVPEAMMRGKPVLPLGSSAPFDAKTHAPGDFVSLLHRENGPLAICAVILMKVPGESNELASAYPMICEGPETELKISGFAPPDADDPDAGYESLIAAIDRNGREFNFFAPSFPSDKKVLSGRGRFMFRLGALAYWLERGETSIEIKEGPMLELERKRVADEGGDPAKVTSVTVGTDSLRMYFDRGSGDFEFQSVIEGIQEFHAFGEEFWSFRVKLMPEEEGSVGVNMLVHKSNVRGKGALKIGDPIRGIAWLQGTPTRKLDTPVGDSWLDSPDIAAKTGEREGIMRMFAIAKQLDALPLGAVVVAQALARLDWHIEDLNDGLYTATVFAAEHPNGSRIVCFVTDNIKGMSEAAPMEESLKQQISKDAKENIHATALFFHVTLTPSGNGYIVSVSTDAGAETITGKLSFLEYTIAPENHKIVNLDATAEKANDAEDASYDPRAAAEALAHGLSEGDLRPLARLLTENVVWKEMGEIIKTRSRVLAVMGARIAQFRNNKNIPRVEITPVGDLIILYESGKKTLFRFQGKGKYANAITASPVSTP